MYRSVVEGLSFLMGDPCPMGESVQFFINWSDGLVLRQQRETQGGFFASKGISLQTGYVYHKLRSFGFGSFAVGSDHKVCIV